MGEQRVVGIEGKNISEIERKISSSKRINEKIITVSLSAYTFINVPFYCAIAVYEVVK